MDTLSVIAGLGNPGKQYEFTRHNIGFLAVDRLAEKYNLVWKERFRGLHAELNINGKKCHLLKPLTYMNLSGESVGELSRYYKVDTTEIGVVYDDLDFSFGTLKLRATGSAGGHNGIKSIISHLNSQDFKRFRMGIAGINRADMRGYTKDYVLGTFTQSEREVLNDFTLTCVDAVQHTIEHGFSKAMNLFNSRMANSTKD